MNTTLMKEKNLVLPTYLIPLFQKYRLNLIESLIFLYLWNNQEETFDISKVGKTLKLKDEEILNAFNSLMSKKLINLKTIKDILGKRSEIVDFTNALEDLNLDYQKEEKKLEETEIYSAFEHEFARTISPMEYEIIHAWLDKGFSEELILGALKEAIYNGVTSLRYIDKILYEWQKKGYKSMKDVETFHTTLKQEETKELFDYNWLEDNEE